MLIPGCESIKGLCYVFTSKIIVISRGKLQAHQKDEYQIQEKLGAKFNHIWGAIESKFSPKEKLDTACKLLQELAAAAPPIT